MEKIEDDKRREAYQAERERKRLALGSAYDSNSSRDSQFDKLSSSEENSYDSEEEEYDSEMIREEEEENIGSHLDEINYSRVSLN